MNIREEHQIAVYGARFKLPSELLSSPLERITDWAVGVFASQTGVSDVEVKWATVDSTERVYNKLEVHQGSAQVFVVPAGSVAVPVSLGPSPESVQFIRVSAGEAIILNERIWHSGAVGIDVPASVIVVLRKGTTAGDTTESSLSRAVELRCLG